MSDEQMSISIPAGFLDVAEATAVPEGLYHATIKHAEARTSKSGNPMVAVTLGLEDDPNAMPVNHFLLFPSDGDDENAQLRKARQFKRFCKLFRLPCEAGELNVTEWLGASAQVKLTLEKDDVYGEQNRLIVPKFE